MGNRTEQKGLRRVLTLAALLAAVIAVSAAYYGDEPQDCEYFCVIWGCTCQ